MTPLLFMGISLGGGVGAALRFVIDGTVRTHSTVPYPLGTMIINVSGSFLLGLLSALLLPTPWAMTLGIGLLGGYTTFSTASFESIQLALDQRYLAAATNVVGMLAVSVAAAWVGFQIPTWSVPG